MKLLHSKIFRDNLKKWLCMYIGVMGILATVVTYSKYISSLHGNSEARVAKFKLDLNCVDSDTIDGNICKTDDFSTIVPLTYKFKVKNEFEVATDLVISVYINDDFKINSVTKNGVAQGTSYETVPITSSGNTFNKKLVKFIYSINATDGVVDDTYEFVIEYNGTDYTNDHNYSSIITVSYSAIQKD